MLEWLADSILRSIFTGSLFFVISVGLTLTLAVVKLPNFAHAEFLTIGAYVGIVISAIFPNNFLITSAVAFAICAVLALVIHYSVFKPMMNRKVSIYILVLASFAVAQFIRYGVYTWAASANLLSATPKLQVTTLFYLGQTAVTNVYAYAILLTIVVSAALASFLNFTVIGKSMRAVASNLDLAKISGINIALVVNVMWVIAGGLGGVGGVVFGVYTTVTPAIGLNTLLEIFSVVIIAGLTSVTGTIIGAYVVGFSENLLMDSLNRYLGLSYAFEPLLPFALIIIILLFKPTGLAPNATTGIAFLKKLSGREQAKKGK